jgi:hypothetical protein
MKELENKIFAEIYPQSIGKFFIYYLILEKHLKESGYKVFLDPN